MNKAKRYQTLIPLILALILSLTGCGAQKSYSSVEHTEYGLDECTPDKYTIGCRKPQSFLRSAVGYFLRSLRLRMRRLLIKQGGHRTASQSVRFADDAISAQSP